MDLLLLLELRAAKIDAELRVTDGGHGSKVRANGLREILPFVADVVRGRGQAGPAPLAPRRPRPDRRP